MDWSALPKVELHLHLDVSLSFEGTAALLPGLTPEAYQRDHVAPEKCANLADFLSRVPPTLALLQTEHGLRTLVADVFRQLAADGHIYAELRFAPLLHTQQGLSAAEVVRIVESATDQGSKDSGIETRLILCSLRHFSTEQSMQTVQIIQQFQGSRVAAFDLAGDEAGFPLTAHLEAFEYAHGHQIPVTSHAGEARGPHSVWDTLYALQPSRIGHGVRSIEDVALVAYLKRHAIHLEICPTCNVQLDVYPTYPAHSIAELYRQDVSLSVSTDNRTLTPITLSTEYQKLAATFEWTKTDFLKCNLNAIQAAFIPESIKEGLRARLMEAYQPD